MVLAAYRLAPGQGVLGVVKRSHHIQRVSIQGQRVSIQGQRVSNQGQRVSKDEPRGLSFRIHLQITTRGSTTSGCFRAYKLSSVLIVRSGKKLLSLTEDTVDLGSADWADALCHTAT